MPSRTITVTVEWDDEDDDLFKNLSDFSLLRNERSNRGGYGAIARRIGIWENGKVIDHIDGNPYNHKRNNLQTLTYAENTRKAAKRYDNSSGYRGVFWFKRDGLWVAQLSSKKINNKTKNNLGYYDDILEAATTWDTAARAVYGNFAQPNLSDVFVTEPIEVKYKRKTWRVNRKLLSLTQSKRGLKSKADTS